MQLNPSLIVILSTIVQLVQSDDRSIQWSWLLDEERDIPIELNTNVTGTENRIHVLNDIVKAYAKSARSSAKEKHFSLLIDLTHYELESYNSTVNFKQPQKEQLAIVATFAFVPHVHEENWIDRTIKVTLNIYVAPASNLYKAHYDSLPQKLVHQIMCGLIFIMVLVCCYSCCQNCKCTYVTPGRTSNPAGNERTDPSMQGLIKNTVAQIVLEELRED